jgi:hypothetical protein
MLDNVRSYVRSRLEGLGGQGSEDVAASLMTRAQEATEQLSALAAGFLQWSAEARKSIVQEVRELVARQIEEMGLATKRDVEALRARLDRIEGRPARGRDAGSRDARSTTPRQGTSRSSTKAGARQRTGSARGAGARSGSTAGAAGGSRPKAATVGRARSRGAGRAARSPAE